MDDQIRIWCNVVEGVTVASRCLWKLSQVIHGNKSCEACILRQLEATKRGAKGAETKPAEKIKIVRKKKLKTLRRQPKDVKKSNDTNASNDTNVPGDQNVLDELQGTFDVCELARLIGKSRRRTQELVKEGKIPGRKVGSHWSFNKAEIAQWLVERKKDSGGILAKTKQEGQRVSPGLNEEKPECHDVVNTTIPPDQEAGEIEKTGMDLEGCIEEKD